MYLTDRQLRARLEEFQFACEDPSEPFDAARQIGPCSVDLRLSSVYWTPRRVRVPPFFGRRIVDLERTRVMELSPYRGWRSNTVTWGDKITLRPGQMILGRIAERFQVPPDCAAALEGRSSYARLGISVHTGAGFVNPGWKGHLPLTLINHSPVTIRIPVGTPICQLLILQLSAEPQAHYGVLKDRKYLNDIGGPSLWWRDEIMRDIRAKFARVSLDSRAFDELDELLINTPDEGVLSRLEDYLARQRPRSYGNAQEILAGFTKSERNHQLLQRCLLNIARGAWAVAIPIFIALFFQPTSPQWWVWALCGFISFLSLGALVWGVATRSSFHLTSEEFNRLAHEKDQRAITTGGADTPAVQ